MKTLRLILGDQINRSISSLQDISDFDDTVMFVESLDEFAQVKHHKQKIVFIFSSMRHFCKSLRNDGLKVHYVGLADEKNTGCLTSELSRAVKKFKIGKFIVTEPSEWHALELVKTWTKKLGVVVEIRKDDRFLCSKDEFKEWSKEKKVLRMENFYRHMRKKTGWLMDGQKPLGGKWNYDAQNRKSLPQKVIVPECKRFKPDDITRDIMSLVDERFKDHFGNLQNYRWAVTRRDAQEALKHFVKHSLCHFGNYQDAMKSGDDFLFHSALSPYLNIGLLSPKEVCREIIKAFEDNNAPIAAVEGFIRQILGWREYVRGVYWLHMPEYSKTNFFTANRSLPNFYWTGNTELNCLRDVIRSTRENAYAHHIQRLMITGNFALLTGISPSEVEKWYLIVYTDAFDWVELPNTHGMALFADGGLLGSKPYAASAAYINRMSDYCTNCKFNPNVKIGENACPFNYLYWNFLLTNKQKLRSNPRMAISYKTLSRMSADRKKQITRQSDEFMNKIF